MEQAAGVLRCWPTSKCVYLACDKPVKVSTKRQCAGKGDCGCLAVPFWAGEYYHNRVGVQLDIVQWFEICLRMRHAFY
jgi:hypothetical protein